MAQGRAHAFVKVKQSHDSGVKLCVCSAPFCNSSKKGYEPYRFSSGYRDGLSLFHKVTGTPSLARGSPCEGVVSPRPKNVLLLLTQLEISMYCSCKPL